MGSETGLDSSKGDSLLVFGYGCRIFDDPEKATYIEEGRHLIPWNGQENHRVDRYDGRIHLTDLPEHGSYPEDEEEKALCDEERYRSLKEAIILEREDENGAEENDVQRNQGYSYDYSQEEAQAQSNKSQSKEIQQPPLSLRTLANLIEKTSEFIVKEGAQMEILMRAKETGNIKFQFLNPDNPYHPIYKSVLEKKRARLKAGGGSLSSQNNPLPLVFDVEKSLRNITLPSAAPGLLGESPNGAKSSFSSNNSSSAYSQLVERIRESIPQPPPVAPETELRASIPPPVTLPEIPRSEPHIVEVTPPKDKELLERIDRTASYVAKNGSDTMSVVRKRSPKDFAFLIGDHPNHVYFQYKVALYKEIIRSRKQMSNGGGGPKVKKDGEGSSAKNMSSSSSILLSSKAAVNIVEQKFPLLKGFFS